MLNKEWEVLSVEHHKVVDRQSSLYRGIIRACVSHSDYDLLSFVVQNPYLGVWQERVVEGDRGGGVLSIGGA